MSKPSFCRATSQSHEHRQAKTFLDSQKNVNNFTATPETWYVGLKCLGIWKGCQRNITYVQGFFPDSNKYLKIFWCIFYQMEAIFFKCSLISPKLIPITQEISKTEYLKKKFLAAAKVNFLCHFSQAAMLKIFGHTCLDGA